ISGRVVNQLPARDRNVAMVFQRSALLPHLTVRRNLLFAARLRQGGLRKLLRRLHAGIEKEARPDAQGSEERAGEIVRLLRLDTMLARHPFELSGGEQQRVALGRALLLQPAVYLLDEPLCNLDAKLRSELRHELHLLQQHIRATMIYVTHDQLE